MNKQPFYHRATILWTATRSQNSEEVQRALEAGIKQVEGTVAGTLIVEEMDDEAGDPTDLMGS